MGPDQPPSSPPSDPFYWPPPANNDESAFLGSQHDERFLDPSIFPEMVQENCLPDPSNQSSMHHALLGSVPSRNGATATFIPHSETFHEPLNLGTLPQQIQCGNPLRPLGTSEYPYIGQPQTMYPPSATSVSLNNWQQSASLPRNSLGSHPRSQERTELVILDSFLGASTSPGLPRDAATASLRQELVEESALQVTNIPPNVARGIELVSPRPADGETTVQVRRDIRITLNFDVKILSSGSATYDGLKIPKTPSVNKEECESGKKLLHLQIRVLGATTKALYQSLCHKCKDRDGDKDAFPDFRAKSNIVVPHKNGRLLVAFTLACCSKHREPQDSEYCLEVVLNGVSEQDTPYFQYQLPYSFSVVSKRTRNQVEDLDAANGVVLPPPKLPKTGSGGFSRVENPVSQGAGPSGLDERSPGDSRGQTNNISPGTSGPPATSVASHRPASSAESPMPSCRNNLAVNTASQQETADGLDPVIEKVIPHRGPATGGPEIGIWGSNFPSDHMPLYAGFGDNFARAVLQMPNVLLCTLPQASVPGKVPVTLRRSPNRNAPVIGTSLCQFEYITDLNEILPIIIRIQEDCSPEVAAALDVLRKEMKNRNLTRNGKRPMRRGEASQDEIETAIIQALAPLQDTLNFEEVISKTNDYNQTLAHFAVFFGYTNLLRRLMGWNIDLSIADVNGFTALHSAYKTGDRVCVDLLLEKGASETVLDTLGRAPPHLMPEGFASLNDHDADTASDDQPELEENREFPSLFQSTDSGHGVSDSGDEKSMNKAVSLDPMYQSQSSRSASNRQSILRSPPRTVAPAQTSLSPTLSTRHYKMPPLASPVFLHASSVSFLKRGQEPPTTSVTRSPSYYHHHPEVTPAVSADNPSAPLIPMMPYNPQWPRSVNHHQDKLTVMNRYASPLPSPPLPHPPHPPHPPLSPPPRYTPPSSTPLSPRGPITPPRPLQLPEITATFSAHSESGSSTADSSPEIQQPSVGEFEQDALNRLEQFSESSFACGELNGGAQAIFVPGTQNREHAAAPRQLEIRTNHKLMHHDSAATVPIPQASLPPTAALFETNPDNGTITLPAWLSLVQPQPEDQVIRVERECQVVLDIKFKELPTLPGQRPVTRKGVVIPSTAKVKTDDYYTEEDVVHLSVRVFGADTKSEYNSVCNECNKQEGKKKGKPSLVDFHAASNVIKASDDGLVQVKFKLSCYPNHQSPNEGAYLLEVALLEKRPQKRMDPSQVVIAKCRLPWQFKVGKRQGAFQRSPLLTSPYVDLPTAIDPRSPADWLDPYRVTTNLLQDNFVPQIPSAASAPTIATLSAFTPTPTSKLSRGKCFAKACDACHESKRRCDGTSPCGSCAFADKPCTYTDTSGRGQGAPAGPADVPLPSRDGAGSPDKQYPMSGDTPSPRPSASAKRVHTLEPKSPLPSSPTNRASAPTLRPNATRNDRYSTLDMALQRINELEDSLRTESDRARAAPPSSSPATVSAAVTEAIAVYEKEIIQLEARARAARENFIRVLSGLVKHSRERDKDVLSSAMTYARQRDWRDSPTDHNHFSHSHHSHQQVRSSPVLLPQSAPHHTERDHLPPPSSSRDINQHAYTYLLSRPSPQPAHDPSQPRYKVINLPPSNSTGSNAIPSGFDLTRERKDHLINFGGEHLAQTGEKRPRAPSVGTEFPSGGGRDHREEKRLRVSREGDWVERWVGSLRKDEDRTIGNGDDFLGTRRKSAGPPSKGGASTAGRAVRGLSNGPIPPHADGADQAEGEAAVGSPDSEITESVRMQPTSVKREPDEAVDDELRLFIGMRPWGARRENTATGAGRREETDSKVDEMVLETVGATGLEWPRRRDPYANDSDHWHDIYPRSRYTRGREGSAKSLGRQPTSDALYSPISIHPTPAHHNQRGSDRDRGYISRNMLPRGMESVSQQRDSVSFPHHSSVGSESTHSSSRDAIYPSGQGPPNSAGGSRSPHLPRHLGPPQPKKTFYSKSSILPPGSATAGPPGPGGNAIRGPGPGPPDGQPVRTCKSCGEPGRYKDGRCVEKWGPGPHGPGTVCDRCRKKVKRVEKQSGMKAAADAAQNSLAAAGGHGVPYVQGHPYPRVDHLPERGAFVAIKQEHSESTVALDDLQSQAHSGRSQAHYGQDHYRSGRISPSPYYGQYLNYLTRRESCQSGASQERHRDERGRPSVLPSYLDVPLTSSGASGASGESHTVLPPRGKEQTAIHIERTGNTRGGEKRDTSRCDSREREDEDDDADGGAEMDQLEEDLVRNKVKKEGLVDLVLTVKKEDS